MLTLLSMLSSPALYAAVLPDGRATRDPLEDASEDDYDSPDRDYYRVDSDGDGLSDGLEFELGTDPELSDTDGDGLDDYEEVEELDSDPLVADGAPGLLVIETCMEYGLDDDGAVVMGSYVLTDGDDDSSCLYVWPLGEFWDGPDADLVPVYRFTASDGMGSHRLSTSSTPLSGETGGELLFYAEPLGAGVGDTVYAYEGFGSWWYSPSQNPDWEDQGFDQETEVFETAN